MAYNWGTGLGDAASYGASGFQLGGPIGGMIGAGAGLLGGFFGNGDDTRKAANMMDNIPGRVKKFYDPYINAGNQAIPQLQEQYGHLLNDPGGMINQIGAGYKQSPGFQFAMQQALAGGDRAAAAGGYSGAPRHNLEGMETAEGLASKDFENYLSHALSQYGLGLKGEEGFANMGQKGGEDYADMLAQALAQEAKMKYGGQNYGA